MITAKLMGPNFVTVMINGVTKTITDDHANYNAIREALKANNHAMVEKLMSVADAIKSYVGGTVTIVGNRVMYKNNELKGSVVDRIVTMLTQGFDPAPMLKFLENLMQNPSKRAVDELYGFLEATKLPITEDGHFLAYKKVDDKYMDLYTGTIDNSIGKIVEMERNQVNEDKDQTCSTGLHFCSLAYLPMYHGGSGRVMIVKINPKDVVSIPSDYNNAKGRTCRYEVVGEHTQGERVEGFISPVYTDKVIPAVPKASFSWDADISTSSVSTEGRNPSLDGYNKGRGDASKGLGYNDTSSFVGAGAKDRYMRSYKKGWNSIQSKKAVSTEKKTIYQLGYDAGHFDYSDGLPYHSSAYDIDLIDHEMSEWNDGYSDGWYAASIEED